MYPGLTEAVALWGFNCSCEGSCGICDTDVANYRWGQFDPVVIKIICVADAEMLFGHLQLVWRVFSAIQLTTKPSHQC